MSVTVQLGIGGTPVPDAFYDAIQQLEVEESSDQPGALLLRLPVNRNSAGDLQFVGDGTFEPQTNITLTVTPGTPGSRAQCIFDGYVLSWRLHLDRASTSSTIDVWAQDASWLMNIDDHVAEWSGQTDGRGRQRDLHQLRVHSRRREHGQRLPRPSPDGHTLFQRATDLQFLRGLARRGGKLCRVACTDTPGARTGYFVTPAVDGQPVATISLIDPDSWTVDTLDFDWDVMRPTEVDASQVDLTQPSDRRHRRDHRHQRPQRPRRPRLPHLPRPVFDAAADGAGRRARARPAHGGACSPSPGSSPAAAGEADADRIGAILRVGDVVTIEGAGSLQSGNWLVWNVRHTVLARFLEDELHPGPQRDGPGGRGRHARLARPAPRPGRPGRRRCDRGRRPRARGPPRAAAHPFLRQVPRHRDPTSTRPRCGSRRRCRRCSARPTPAGACRASPTPGRASASPSCPRPAAASGSSSRAGTCPTRSGSAATGARASSRPTRRSTSR